MDPNKTNPQDPNAQPEAKPLDYQQDVHNASMEDIVAQQHKAEAEWADEWNNPPAEKPKEPETQMPSAPAETTPVTPAPVVEEPKPPTSATPPPPALSADEIADKVTAKVVENLNPATVEEKKGIEDKLKDLQDKAKADGREITYTEALSFLKEETKAELTGELTETITKQVRENLDKEIAAEEKQKADAKDAQDAQQKKNNDVMVGEWNRQVTVLQNEQNFPKPEDPGFAKAKDVLFQALKNRADKATKEGKPVSVSLIEAFHSPEHRALTQQDGREAPVNGARKTVGGEDKTGFTNQELHNMQMEDIVREHYEKQGWS